MTAEVIKFDDAAATFERDRKVQRLLLAGAQARDIAEQLACSIDEVHQSQMRMTAGIPPDFKARVLQLDLERMDKLHQSFWVAAMKGDAEAAKVIFRAAEHRAKLLGMYPPPMRHDLEDLRPKQTSTDRIEAVLNQLKEQAKTIDGEVIEEKDDGG